jgi:hypothetical protein
LIDHQLTKWLADHRKLTAVEPALHLWIEQVLVPHAGSAGWKYWALLQPELPGIADVMRTISVTLAISGITVFVFDDPAAAHAWLDAQDDLSVSPYPTTPLE